MIGRGLVAIAVLALCGCEGAIFPEAADGKSTVKTLKSVVQVRPDDQAVQTIGRVAKAKSGELMFDAPDVQVRVAVKGVSSVTVLLRQFVPKINAQPSLFAVYVDNKMVKCASHPQPNAFSSFSTSGAGNNTIERYTFEIGDNGKARQVAVFKLTEPAWDVRNISANYVTFSGFEMAGSAPTTLPGPPLPKRKLEFLGDSITAGFCNLCHRSNETGVNLESGALSWPNMICDMLGAQCHKIAWSGFGMVRNCCGGDTYMPAVYQRTIASVEEIRWDFSSWVPDAVVINLGTNDLLPPEPDPVDEEFVNTYIDLVMNTAHKYDFNRTHFFLACGPMSEHYCPEVSAVIKNVTSAGVLASFLDQRQLIKSPCCGHPSVSDDIRIANSGAAFIKDTLHWDDV